MEVRDPGTILAVDDQLVFRICMPYIFPKDRVLAASDLREALEWIHQGHVIDLVLCDYYLKNIHGDDVLREIRKHLPHVKTFLISAMPAAQLQEIAQAAGVDNWMIKPFCVDELRSRVDRLMNSRSCKT